MTTALSTKVVTARKVHRCDYCGLPIQVGHKYERSFNLGDSVYTWKSHLHCQQLADKIIDFKSLDDEGCSSDDFYNHVAHEWSSINGKSNLGQSYHKMLDEVLKHHKIKTVKEENNG